MKWQMSGGSGGRGDEEEYEELKVVFAALRFWETI